MLQIASGRFFGAGEIRTGDFDAVLYSNFSWAYPVRTAGGELRPGNTKGRISSYVLRYTIRHELHPNSVLLLPTGNQLAEQLSLLAGLWFQAIFHPDRNHIESLCRPDTRHANDDGVPSQFIDSFFGAPLMSDLQSVEGFQTFVRNVIAMPRASFRLFMSCLRVFFNALEAIDTNKDLAYSMFVYVLEGLTQGSDGFVPTWDDLPDDTRGKIDRALSGLPAENASAVRQVLSDNPHLKLMKRFVEFTTDHVDNSFFTFEASHRLPALPRSELQQALKNLYNSRSGFVHALERVQEHIRTPLGNTSTDYFHWDNQPHFTFSGVARLCRHILLSFVKRQPSLEREDYPKWRTELPGMLLVRAAPQYWIWQAEAFRPETIKRRFSGFVEHITERLADVPLQITDMRPVIQAIGMQLPQSKRDHRDVMVCLYWLWHQFFPDDNWFKRIKVYVSALESCSIQMMAASIILNERFSWTIDECEREFAKYLKSKFRRNEIRLPPLVEVAIESEIASVALRGGTSQKFFHWLDRAIFDAAGNQSVQEYLQRCKIANEQVDTDTVLGIPTAARAQELPLEEWLMWL